MGCPHSMLIVEINAGDPASHKLPDNLKNGQVSFFFFSRAGRF